MSNILGAASYFDFVIAFIGGFILSISTSLHLFLKGRGSNNFF